MHSRFAIGALLACSLAVTSAQQPCNGYNELCAKPYDSLTYVLTHNSYAFSANPAANQLCGINDQLADGVRALKLSAVKPTNSSSSDAADAIRLCHTSCSILDAGNAKDTLTSITAWVKDNPNEVLTIMWNNLGNFGTSDFNALYEASGIIEYSHVQAYGNLTWPTLQELISSGKRVINFLDLGADQNILPWIMPQFNYVFETPYNNSNETSFSCVIDRPSNPEQPDEMMYVMNHFLYGSLVIEIPQKGSANVTNAASLMKQSKTCTTTFGRQPNFLEVDFYNKGTTLQIAAELNNVTYTGTTLKCDTDSSSGGSSSTTSTSDATNTQGSRVAMLLFIAVAVLVL